MLEVAATFALPLLTFALGVLSTFAFKKWEEVRSVRKEAVRRCAQLCGEWYAQILEYIERRERNRESLGPDHYLNDYLRSRHLLPLLIEEIETLRKIGQDRAFVDAVEYFLSSVTTLDKGSVRNALRDCAHQLQCHSFASLTHVPDWKAKEEHDSFLSTVDKRLQRVSRIAGWSRVK